MPWQSKGSASPDPSFELWPTSWSVAAKPSKLTQRTLGECPPRVQWSVLFDGSRLERRHRGSGIGGVLRRVCLERFETVAAAQEVPRALKVGERTGFLRIDGLVLDCCRTETRDAR